MARDRGAQCKQCRREGEKLFLKGERCLTDKYGVERRTYAPGDHGRGRVKQSEFGVQLREKQKVRRVYHVLERQFKRYFETAESRPGLTGENLLRLLESRLDNVVFRLGFASSRPQARQLVGHGHFAVNGVPTNVPSFQLKPGDRVEVREASRKAEPFKAARDNLRNANVPDWLTVDPDKLAGTIVTPPRREQMPLEVNEQLVVEYYSR